MALGSTNYILFFSRSWIIRQKLCARENFIQEKTRLKNERRRKGVHQWKEPAGQPWQLAVMQLRQLMILLFSELQKNFPRMNRINVLSFYEFESKNPLCWGVESSVLLSKNPVYICMSKPLVFPLAEESTYLRSS